MSLVIVPIDLAEANAFVSVHHRHHKPVVGHKFSIAAADTGFWLIETRAPIVRGIAIIGRPVARGNDDGWTLEVRPGGARLGEARRGATAVRSGSEIGNSLLPGAHGEGFKNEERK